VNHEPCDPEVERRLLERFRGGDASAFDELVLLHREAVYRVARRIVGAHAQADEVAQETFVRAWRALPGFRGEARLATWLVRIAINVSRSVGVEGRRSVALGEADGVPDPAEGADAGLLRRATRKRIRRAVRDLPPRQREVVALKVFSEMTYEDVASAMGLTVGAVKAHLHQAVAGLRRRLADGEGTR
jgi:RNA polymerase sigma-70 factor, ECF subfamily